MRQLMMAIAIFTMIFAVACKGDPDDLSGEVDSGQIEDAHSPDADSGADADSESDPDSDAGPDSDSDADAGPDSDPADAGSDPDADAEPDADPDPDPGPFVLYLAPDGDDTNSGTSPQEPILTVNQAQTILQEEEPQRDTEILIAPGRYYGQQVVWTYTHPEHEILFSRYDDDAERPVFDGCLVENPTNTQTQCPGGTWFILQHSAGEATNLNFHYIRVERYQTAISFNGNRNSASSFNSHNRIFGCYFDKIGNGFAPHLDPSTAVVRLVNSVDNEIINSHFRDVINLTQPARIHAIYVAHLSSRNDIERNRFVNNTGDAVRLRDYSNDNRIMENTFIKAGHVAGYTDWYCDHDVRDDCTKQEPECPSWNNQFRENELDGTYDCTVLGTFEYFQGDTTTGCSPPTAGSVRLSTSDNVQSASPCSGY